MRQRGRDFPYLHAYVFIVLLGMVAQQGRPLFHGRVKLDNYTLQLLMAAHNIVPSQTKEELLQVGILSLIVLSHARVDRRYYF